MCSSLLSWLFNLNLLEQSYSSENMRGVAAEYEKNSAIQVDMLVAAKTKQAIKADSGDVNEETEVAKEIPAKRKFRMCPLPLNKKARSNATLLRDGGIYLISVLRLIIIERKRF
jgi:hypothetical protein